jgi:hypothetical protein
VPSKKSSPNHTPPVAQDLDLFVQSYRQLQNDCEQYKLQLENYKRSLIEERSKVEQFKTNLMSNFSCFTELDMIRYQHTETRYIFKGYQHVMLNPYVRLKQWDEHSVLFQSVMTSIDRLIAQKNERPKPSTELEMCKSKLRHLYQLWSGQTYDGTWITRYKSVLTSLTEGIQQQRTDISK